jgi:antitoxin component of MazEF toxin-antitoxin module
MENQTMFKLDERSLINIKGSLLMTLPKIWIKNNDLHKGDRVNVDLDRDGRLVITPIREHAALPDMNLGGLDQVAPQHTSRGVVANVSGSQL